MAVGLFVRIEDRGEAVMHYEENAFAGSDAHRLVVSLLQR
jgi:hypothetical protein